MARKPTNRAAGAKITDTTLQEAGGAEETPKVAAASDDATEAKVSEAKGTDAADPAGAEPVPAAGSEQSREQAEDASADRKGASEEGKQPEDTAQPPVAGPLLVVRGPKGGRRRAGFVFGPEPVTLTREELPKTDEGIDALLAILADPRLRCHLINSEGEECLVTDEVASDLIAECNEARKELGE